LLQVTQDAVGYLVAELREPTSSPSMNTDAFDPHAKNFSSADKRLVSRAQPGYGISVLSEY
jgi:hypothetical protein